MAIPQPLQVSFERFSDYPINLVFEREATDELKSCGDRLKQSTQDKPVKVHFLDLNCSAGDIDTIEVDITNESDLNPWLQFGRRPGVQPLLPQAINTQAASATHNSSIQPNPSTATQTAISNPQPTTSSQTILSRQAPAQIPQQAAHAEAAGRVQSENTVAPIDKQDPTCRFIFLHAAISRSRLRVSHSMLARMFTHHQVIAGFVDFISVFGTQAESRGQRFCGFRVRNVASAPDLTVSDTLRRSGQYYQICYNLRSAGSSPPNNTWSIRQTVFHHQFDVKEGTSLWISACSAKGDEEMQKMIHSHVNHLENSHFEGIGKCFTSTLTIHKMYSGWCTKGWLEYIEYLESRLESLENELEPLMSGKGQIFPFNDPTTREITIEDLKNVQYLERKSNEALMTLDANANILASLRDFYANLVQDQLPVEPHERDQWTSAEKAFSRNLKGRESELHRFETRCKRLVQLTADQKSLVIKQLEFQSSKKMERLSYETFYLGKLAQKEAVAVRIITIVSLVYLPCSVVSSIFSTDIVKFQTGTIGVYKTSFSWLALQRWIEVTFPLTFVTLTLGFFGYQFEKWRQNEDIKQERDELMSLETHETLGTI